MTAPAVERRPSANNLGVHRSTTSGLSGTSNLTGASSATLVNGLTSPNVNGHSQTDTKNPVQELEQLHDQLALETRIKEGAENLLEVQQTKMDESLRLQVESELERALRKIDAIKAKIDSISLHRKKGSSGSSRKAPAHLPLPRSRSRDINPEERDDFRTALHQANIYLKTLQTSGRTPSSPTTASSSSPRRPPPKAQDPQMDRTRIDNMNKLTTLLQRNLRVRYELDISEVVRAVTPALSDYASKECRACAYRLVRHALVDGRSIERLQEHSIDWYIVKSLARDNKSAVEKEQVIKLIRTIVEIGSDRGGMPSTAGQGTVPLSEAVMRAFIAIAEHPEDPFSPICVETLIEILLIDIDLVAKTGGIRPLLHALAEGPLDMAPLLASAFLYIVDSPRTRVYLSPGTDLEIAFSGITDAYGKGQEHVERMQCCAKSVAMMLRTWSGLLYFCMGDMITIRAIIDTLRIPSLETRDIILDLFFDLLDINRSNELYQPFLDGRRLTVYRKVQAKGDAAKPKSQDPAEREHETLKLTDQYVALLVLVFTKAGLLDALTAMLEESTTGSNLTRKATLLMAEVMQLANRLLPLEMAAEIQAIPRVFNLASDYGFNEHRVIGSFAMSAIDSFNRNTARAQPTEVKTDNNRPRANSVEDAVRRGQRAVEQSKIKMGMQMDDKTFGAALIETGVMLTKDHTKWSFDTLQDLIDGPLLNPKRMEEAIKVSNKFMRRLMSFFHPFSHRFSDIPRKTANQRWVRLGCNLLTTLLASQDGQRFLSTEDPFLRDVVKAFAQLDPFNGMPDSDPIFSKTRVQETLTYGYLEMLGTMSKQKEGLELMEKFKVFTAFYHLMDLRSREDLIKGIINNLDYNSDGHPRIVFSKALTCSSKHIRLYATGRLGDLIKRNTKANVWTLRLLLTQLYDPAMEVCDMAVRFLEEACDNPEILRLVVDMQPILEHLGEIGDPLLLKFMSTPMGFRYLHDSGYIDREIDMWFHERNMYYVVQVEVYLARAQKFCVPDDEGTDTLGLDSVPPHFYGEMAKTELGCQVLSAKGHFNEFADFIRQQGLENDDPDVILKLKSILWAVGNIGATERGLPFLEESNIIPVILAIAEQSLTLSVRGTCFYMLGLISSTHLGAEFLADYGWEATLSPLHAPTGICVPTDLEKFTSIPSWCPAPLGADARLVPPVTDAEQEIVTAVYNLANTVIANTASRSLAKMKSRPEHRNIFSSPSMIYRALHILSTQHYRLPVRRYIMDLFDFTLDADMVRSLQECAQSIRRAPSQRPSANGKPVQRVVSIFGRPGRGRRSTESDESEDEKPQAAAAKPVMSLRPMSRIIGFDR